MFTDPIRQSDEADPTFHGQILMCMFHKFQTLLTVMEIRSVS